MKIWCCFWMLPFLIYADISWQADIQKPFAVTVKLHPQTLVLGESLYIEMEAQYPSSYNLDFDTLVDQLIWSANPLMPQWTLIDFKLSPLAHEINQQSYLLNIELTPINTGSLKLSFLQIAFLSKDSHQSPIHLSMPVYICQVLPPNIENSLSSAPLLPLEPEFPLGLTEKNRALLIDNPKEIDAAKEIIQGYLKQHSFPLIAIVVLFGCGGIGWTAYLLRDKWPKLSFKNKILILPQQEIAQSLQALQKVDYDPTQPQHYYAASTNLLLKVLQIVLGKKASTLTTSEMDQTLKTQTALSSSQIKQVLTLLTEIDQVKFANKKPTALKAELFFQQLQDCIQQLMKLNERAENLGQSSSKKP